MRFTREVHEQYQKAYALASRNQQKNKKQGLPVCLIVLDNVSVDRLISYRMDLGVMEIPTRLIVGIAEDSEKKNLYTKEFLPLSNPNSEAANSWRYVYNDFVSSKRFNDEVQCLEYLGKFYISDGLKRVSIAKYLGEPVIRAQVIRIMPIKTDVKEVEQYYDFLFQHRITGLYQLQFTQPGYFEMLQHALGKSPTGKWEDCDRKAFLRCWPTIENAFLESYADCLKITAADALVVLLNKYSYSQIAHMDLWVLARIFQANWKELYSLSYPDTANMGRQKSIEKLQTA